MKYENKNQVYKFFREFILAITVIILSVTPFMILNSVAMPITVNAAETEADDTQTKQYVIDDADILTDQEESRLTQMCKEASENCMTDIVIITMSKGLDGTALDNYIRNIIETQYGYAGTGTNSDAIVYVIDMSSRADRIVTSGNARSEISQSNLDTIREDAEDKLADGNYYSGCKKFIEGVQKNMNYYLSYRLLLYLPEKIIAAAAIAVIAVLLMMVNAKAKMTVNGHTYIRDHQFDVRRREDRYINTTVVTRRIERHDNHGGGGPGGGGGRGGGNSGSSGGHF